MSKEEKILLVNFLKSKNLGNENFYKVINENNNPNMGRDMIFLIIAAHGPGVGVLETLYDEYLKTLAE
jgi:mannitol-specific phosphotransferase system IIBC component